MSIHIHEVLDYLDAHPVCCHQGSVESLLEMLHDAYISYNSIDSEKIHGYFEKINGIMENLPDETVYQIRSLVCDLCMEHEVVAFSHGIVVGMHLISEVNVLP